MRLKIWISCLCYALFVGCGNTEPPKEDIVAVKETGGKEQTETLALNYQELELPERHYLVFLQELSLLDMDGFLGEESRALRAAAKKAGVVATGPTTSLFYEWDTDSGRGTAAVALPVGPETKLAPYVNIKLPAVHGLALEFSGSYERLSAMHYALDAEMQRLGHKPLKPSIEEYIVGPPDSVAESAYRTRIIYPFEAPAQ